MRNRREEAGDVSNETIESTGRIKRKEKRKTIGVVKMIRNGRSKIAIGNKMELRRHMRTKDAGEKTPAICQESSNSSRTFKRPIG